jgi:hypothetical protein
MQKACTDQYVPASARAAWYPQLIVIPAHARIQATIRTHKVRLQVHMATACIECHVPASAQATRHPQLIVIPATQTQQSRQQQGYRVESRVKRQETAQSLQACALACTPHHRTPAAATTQTPCNSDNILITHHRVPPVGTEFGKAIVFARIDRLKYTAGQQTPGSNTLLL